MSNVLESKIPTANPIPVNPPTRPPRTQALKPPTRTLPPLPKKPRPPDYPPMNFSNTIADMPKKIESKESEIYEDDFEEE